MIINKSNILVYILVSLNFRQILILFINGDFFITYEQLKERTSFVIIN